MSSHIRYDGAGFMEYLNTVRASDLLPGSGMSMQGLEGVNWATWGEEMILRLCSGKMQLMKCRNEMGKQAG